MYKIEQIRVSQIHTIVSLCERTQFPYHEYSFLDNSQLSDYFYNRITKSLIKEDSIALAISEGSKFKGMICCVKDDFDSNIFGFGCYRIEDILVFSSKIGEVKQITDKLITTVEENLISKSTPVYITLSLNNNLKNVDYLFNALTSNHFYYIHTLVTFYSKKKRFDALEFYPKENLLIRQANENDAEQVAALAQKSFLYSRFHLDPHLDNVKASELLRTSAINSILQGFVDVMFVAEINKKIVGYYSGKKKQIAEFERTYGEAVISAVDTEYRGLKVFSKLDVHLLNWFANNTDFAEMGTYLVNFPVHKTWINKGLEIIRGTHQFSKFILMNR